MCVAVTCHLHFWQNEQDLSRATAATRGQNGYPSKIPEKFEGFPEEPPIEAKVPEAIYLSFVSAVTT